MKRLSLRHGVMAALLATTALAPMPATAAQNCAANSNEVVSATTLHVVIEPGKKLYRVGDIAEITATVTRPAHEDPLGQNIPVDPPMSQPAQNVNVGVGVQVERVYLFGFSKTDAQGKATIKVKVAPYTPPGDASVRALAWSVTLESICLTIEEQGFTHDPALFKVAR